MQTHATAMKGNMEMYWFENKHIGLEKTLFHRIHIPLKPFNSQLDEPQPVNTQIVIEWLDLGLEDPANLDGLNISSTPEDASEISIYLGQAHNPCDIKELVFKKLDDNLFEIRCELFLEFGFERVAQNEHFSFTTEIELDDKIKE